MSITLKLSFQELNAVHYFLSQVISQVGADHRSSLYIQIQLELLAEVLVNKVHPRSLVDTGKPVKIKLKRAQALAFQLAVMNGWARYCPDVYTQNVIRRVSMEELPKVVVGDVGQLLAPDDWGE